MKQIRVTSPFFDMTVGNQRRKAGETLVVPDERAAYLVSGKLCEYVEEEDGKQPETAGAAEMTYTTERPEKPKKTAKTKKKD